MGKQIPAPAPIVQAAPVVYETFAPTYSAPIVETFAPSYGATYGAAPIVETFAPTYGAAYGGPVYGGSISAALPMTTMAAPMTTMAAPMTTVGTPFVGTSYGLPPTIF